MISEEEIRITRRVLQHLYDSAPETPPEELTPIEAEVFEGIKNSLLVLIDVLNVVVEGERLEIFREQDDDLPGSYS